MAPRPPAEATGLLALMLLHDARRDARLDRGGRHRGSRRAGPQPLGSSADRRGAAAGRRRRCAAGPGRYAVQAAIAALHCQAARPEDTDWPQILRLYDRAGAPAAFADRVAEPRGRGRDGGRSGARRCALIDALPSGDLDDYHLLHAARADLLRRAGSLAEAAESYARALELVTNDSERRFLERRLSEVQSAAA